MTWKRIQLGLIHVAVAMTLVPINSTLNRVMIKELSISALLVGVMAALPYLFSPIQVAIGSFSDRHPIFGWRRTPYIFIGLLLCVFGVIAAPHVAYKLAENRGLGILMGVLVFGAWGMGYNLASVSYFSLATEISGEKGRSRTIAVMFFMMIVSIIGTSITLSKLLEEYNPDKLINSFLIVGLIAFVFGMIGTIGLESRKAKKEVPEEKEESQTWGQLYKIISQNKETVRFLVYLIILLTGVFAQDILLEPYGAEAFDLEVDKTTFITAIWGTMFLVSLSLGSIFENRVPKLRQAKIGAWGGIIAFGFIVLSSVMISPIVFYTGVVLLGLATGLSTVSNLSLMLDMTISGNIGLFIGVWGMASALSRLTGNLMSGAVRDIMTKLVGNPIVGYSVVFMIEIGLLLVSLFLLQRIDVNLFKKQVERQMPLIERAAVSSEV